MKILEKQGYHVILLGLLLIGVSALARGPVLEGSFLGVGTPAWLWISILVPVVHQVYVLLCWRAELYYQSLSKRLGGKAFPLYGIGFTLLFLARPAAILGLAAANQGTFPLPAWLVWSLSLVFLGLVFALAYSVLLGFGIPRAMGLDHFQREAFRHQKLARTGIFRWFSNPMYLFGFLLLYVPGLLLMSGAALLVALFNHLYIWLHYYFTELPDMRTIYSPD